METQKKFYYAFASTLALRDGRFSDYAPQQFDSMEEVVAAVEAATGQKVVFEQREYSPVSTAMSYTTGISEGGLGVRINEYDCDRHLPEKPPGRERLIGGKWRKVPMRRRLGKVWVAC